jgi:hypothetical protein
MGLRISGRWVPVGKLKFNTLPPKVGPYVPPENPKPPIWVTGAGYLATFAEGEVVNYPLIATDVDNDIIAYEAISGQMPPGLSVNILSGHITGTVGDVLQDTRYTFSVRVTDRTNYTTVREFEVLIVNEATTVTWLTDGGDLADIAPGQTVDAQLAAESN